MSIDDIIKESESRRITGPPQEKKVSMKDIDPSVGSDPKYSKDVALERIEDCMREMKDNIREILQLLRQKAD